MSSVETSARIAEDRPLIVTRHALDRYRARYSLPATVSDSELEVEIALVVTAAFEAGRVRNHKTGPFMLYREKRGELPPGDRFCFDQAEQVGFFVRRGPTDDVVTTTLSRARS